jgi:drug/metabolite transporter (DMT)-like permease
LRLFNIYQRIFFQIFAVKSVFLNNKGNTIFLAVTACLLWSTAYPGIKIGLQYDTPFHFAGARFIISGLIILPFSVKPAVYISMIWEHRKIVATVTLLQTVLYYTLFYQGLKLVPGSLGAVIAGSQPLITALVASAMHKEENITLKKMVTIISGIAGVILISAGRQALKLGSVAELLGVLMVLGANASASVSNVIISVRSRDINPFVLSSFSLFAGGVILFLVSIPAEGLPSGPMPLEYWISLAWLSFMAATAFSIWYKLLKRPGVRVSELNLWKFLLPPAGALLSWLIVPDESPEILTISGIIIITGSLIMFYRNKK